MRFLKLASRLAATIAFVLLLGLGALRPADFTSATSGPVPSFLNTDYATDNRRDDRVSLAGDGAGHWIALWNTWQTGIGPANAVYRSSSSDDGATWSAPLPLGAVISETDNAPQPPTITTDRSGTWIATWATQASLVPGDGNDYDLVYRRSFDNGATWTAPAPLDSSVLANADQGAGSVGIAFGDSAWIAIWSGADANNDADIFVSRSTDGGATWSAQAFLSPSEAHPAQGDSDQVLATDGSGSWMAAWHAAVGGGPVVGVLDVLLVARSGDNGLTWTDPVELSPGGTPARGYAPKLATDGMGTWGISWNQISTRELFTSVSTDLGETWSAALSHGSSAAPDEPALAFGAGTWFLEWEAAPSGPNQIAYSPDGQIWSPPFVVSSPAGGGHGTVATAGYARALVAYTGYFNDTDLLYVFCDQPLVDPDCDSITNNEDDCPMTSDYSQANQDGDPFGDKCDSCPTLPESAQADREGDGVGDACDNCPSWSNPYQTLPGWPISPGDDDCDGFPDTVDANGKARETYIGTDALRHCAATPGANNEPLPDAMPQDFNDDQLINGQDTGKFGGPFGSFNKLVSAGPFGPSGNQLPGERFDFNGNGIINGQDTGKYQAYYNKTCA